MSRPTDRSQDPSPFAWIFGGALALLAAGSVVRALAGRRRHAASPVVAGSSGGTTDGDVSGDDADLAGHPS